MRIGGRKIEGPNEEILVIPRSGPDGNIVLKARAVLDMEEFNAMCPTPKPARIRKKDGTSYDDVKDVKYTKAIDEYASRRTAYLVIKSLEATEDLEWDTVQMGDPSTWGNYLEELKGSGFSEIEVNRIVMAVMRANCLDEQRLEEARASFLAGQDQAETERSGQNIGQNGTPSGVPVSV